MLLLLQVLHYFFALVVTIMAIGCFLVPVRLLDPHGERLVFHTERPTLRTAVITYYLLMAGLFAFYAYKCWTVSEPF
jgi:predicted MFS family arabinose efflux permease